MSEPHRVDRRSQTPDGNTGEAESTDARPWFQSRLVRISMLVLVAAVAAFLVNHSPRFSQVIYAPGDVARQDVKAVDDFLVADPEATERKRRDAELASASVYDFDPRALSDTLAELAEELKLQAPHRPSEGERVSARVPEGFRSLIAQAEVARVLAVEGRQTLESRVRAALEDLYARGVVANRSLFVSEARRGIVVRNLATREEKPLVNPSSVEDFDEIRKRLAEGQGARGSHLLARRLAGALLRPNLTFNSEETGLRRAAARDAVSPVLFQVRRGEMLVREGDRVSADQARRLTAHAHLARDGGMWHSWLGVFLLSILFIYAAYDFGRSNIKKFRASHRDLVFLSSVLILWLAIERVGLLFATGLETLLPGMSRDAVLFALPMGAAAMVVRSVLNSETALLFSLPFFALASIAPEGGLVGFVYFLVGGLVGAHRTARACRRMDFLRAGLWMGLAQVGAAWGLSFLQGGALGPELPWVLGGALVGGLVGGLLSLSAVPVAEGVFGYTTDMKLMELASLDHPLLRSLMLRAPGTYHHAIVTGSLVKSAAEAIGARALLASVAAYYHDIGKLSKPAYFVENQSEGGNRHDKLSPSMSSLILISHVKEGVELARKHRLGRDIIAIIGQHHGTSLIRYFYDKACQKARPGVDEVKESDYRYPGPKPRSREAALVLLADAVEAAARTMRDPRPARIQGMVQTIVNRIFSDGQLDDCDLTLHDLHEIARSFTRILTGIHHQRIDYPLAVEKEKRAHGDLDSERLRGGRDRRGETAAAGGESLKRLGM